MSRLSGFMVEMAWDPAAILDGDEAAVQMVAPGAKVGDFAFVTFSRSLQTLQMTASITGDDQLQVQLSNSTGGTINLGSGTLRAKVVKHEEM